MFPAAFAATNCLLWLMRPSADVTPHPHHPYVLSTELGGSFANRVSQTRCRLTVVAESAAGAADFLTILATTRFGSAAGRKPYLLLRTNVTRSRSFGNVPRRDILNCMPSNNVDGNFVLCQYGVAERKLKTVFVYTPPWVHFNTTALSGADIDLVGIVSTRLGLPVEFIFARSYTDLFVTVRYNLA